MLTVFVIIAGFVDTWALSASIQPIASDVLVEPLDWVSAESLVVGSMD